MKNWLQSVALALSLLISQAGAQTPSTPAAAGQTATAIFAGGCFWCVEADFDKVPGVLSAQSGYTGGKTANPTYQTVSAGSTGHTEAVRLTYDPRIVSYAVLLDFFWHHIDPTVKDRQFCDTGNQYRSAIYYNSPAQKAVIEASKAAILKSGVLKEIHTEIAPASTFYPAEDYHQDYYNKNPLRYKYYRLTCGRDSRVAEVWGTKN
ncbi:peptide-methionine (S)-S-oxide reductase [Polaromonas sp. CG_9.5]|uniref:peptide-methionine (S)-S-oxide reductase MsrA n=1 Tax=Polaromonas sp. CG_9.5 TaxID=3071705 RepID=UPI002E0424AC|nr:peptide-methionine (S)-S-oxide reductase [Polaromonas sp. CG_9.5]